MGGASRATEAMGETIINRNKKTGKNKTGETEKREKAERKKAPVLIVRESEPASSDEAEPDAESSGKKAKPEKGKKGKARSPAQVTPPKAGKSRKKGTTFVDELDLAANNIAKFVDQGRRVLRAAMSASDGGETPSELALNAADATRTLGAVVEAWMKDPERAAGAQAELTHGLGAIWTQTLRRLSGEEVEPFVPVDPADKRFSAPEWKDSPFFDFLRQSYSHTSRWADEMVERAEGLDPTTRSKAAFYTRLISSAISPANFVATNPELLRATWEARGANLVRGLEMLAEDLKAGGGTLKIRHTDQSKFELGVDMATTPGKVILRNDLIELIQYAPTTAEVLKRPLLIVPPWINKFYVLDLNREKSFVRWAVDRGLTVFIISWVNPDSSQADLSFSDYMRRGVLAALDAIEAATGERYVSAAGYCVGGTLLASTLAYMAATGDDRIQSATFFATQVDFTHAGDMQIFIDKEKLAALEDAMSKTGYLDGVKMANTFNVLRPNELVWNYIVNNYVKGETPSAFDLLAWNADSTRIPRANHSFYLRNCYLENNLARGKMVIDGVTLDLKNVTIPIYEIAAKEDHIAPARSVFLGAKLFGGPVEYVLGGAGHVAGIINPPEKRKYQYWLGGPVQGEFDEWCAAAEEIKGSWWPHWIDWYTRQSPEKVPARRPGGGKLEPICDAPGEYVRVRA